MSFNLKAKKFVNNANYTKLSSDKLTNITTSSNPVITQ